MAKVESCKIYSYGDYYLSQQQDCLPDVFIQGGEDSPHPGYDAQDDIIDPVAVLQECESEPSSFSGVDQTCLAPERSKTWPVTSSEVKHESFTRVYEKVKLTGKPNERGAKITIPTKLNSKIVK